METTELTPKQVPDEAPKEQKEAQNIEFLLDIPLQVSVEAGRTRILVKDLLQMQEGHVIELDKLAGEPLDLYVNSRLIARGEAVLINEKFGIRLTDVVSPSERIENLG
ncbi:MAG: flagellar motor switch protein FliN [Desulfuromonas sp.]|uniref:flagellar motor switch protein FliN n=1 Tax=Desulfuromonas sp. TaxID=892 RepID=UPI000CAADB26|nr:flagellar motor switch protein FliN [Desulfuromonas sp.]PLX84487.1 MAG: flagellar motor switch protein FliN [Desulfuromonas sp.]